MSYIKVKKKTALQTFIPCITYTGCRRQS